MFDLLNWYWLHSDGRIYASARKAIIDDEDAAYIAWRKAGNYPTPWPWDEAGEQTDAALQEVLFPHRMYFDLGAAKAELKAAVDQSAENERLKYITPGAGQAMTYQQKVDEARAFKVAGDPKAADYPVLSSEVGITAETLSEVSDIVLAAFAQWQQIGAAIETVRLGAKRDIDAATDEAAARAIVDAIEWPQPAL